MNRDMVGLFTFLKQSILKKVIDFKFLKLHKKEEVEEDSELKERFLEEINDVKMKLLKANNEFNLQTNKDLITYSIYEIKSLEAKYSFLIKEARRKNIRFGEKVLAETKRV